MSELEGQSPEQQKMIRPTYELKTSSMLGAGGEHVPLSEATVTTISVDEEFIAGLKEAGENDLAERIRPGTSTEAQVTIQEKVDLGENQTSLHVNQLNMDDLDSAAVDRLQHEFSYDNPEQDYSADLARDYPSLSGFFEKIDQDERLAQQAADFTRRLIEYTEMTGDAIDLSGRGNVIFYEKDGSPNYVLLDALQKDPTNFIREHDRFKMWLGGETEGTNINEVVPHDIHYLRAINALAYRTGVNERVRTVAGQPIEPFVSDVVDHLRSTLKK